MDGAERDVDALIGLERQHSLVDGHPRGAGDHHPVLGAVLVALQAEPAAGRHDDLLDLASRPLVQHLEAAPGALLGAMGGRPPGGRPAFSRPTS